MMNLVRVQLAFSPLKTELSAINKWKNQWVFELEWTFPSNFRWNVICGIAKYYNFISNKTKIGYCATWWNW